MLPQKILDFTLRVLDFALQVHNFSRFAHNKVRHSLLLKCVHRNLTQFSIGGQLSTSVPIFSSGLSMHTNRNELKVQSIKFNSYCLVRWPEVYILVI